MPNINILSPHVADLIAAGEVVERPASVVKELVENAFDAGAKNVTVELRGGGMTYLRVTDDGCGMAPEDAGIAFLRHATSKLRDEHGLEAIGTLGFRGEALAAISAVSHIELTTRRTGAPSGTRMTLDAGDIQTMYETGCPEGTTLIVRDLFYNTPARLKFMKSDRTEGSACVAAAFRCALGRPDVSVRCIKDGEEQFFSPGDSREDSCVYSLLGRDTAAAMLACRGENDGVAVHGFVSSPGAGRGNRTQQYFFCNGRYIKSATLQAALEQAYRNTLLTGRFPACVLYIELSCAAVDVNVHPAKTEVKFTQEKKVFDAVYYAARSALEGERRTAEITLSEGTRQAAQPKPDFYRSMTSKEFRSSGLGAAKPAAAPVRQPAPASAYRPAAPRAGSAFRSPTAPRPASAGFSAAPIAAAAQTVLPDLPDSPLEAAAPKESPARLIGEAMDTYILVEKGDTLLLIDKHAAHERINFDRLRRQDCEIMSQTLLTPAPFTPDAADADALRANLDALNALGFALEPLGEDAFMIRAVPAQLDPADACSAVEEICEQLRRGGAMDARAVRDEILKTVACKAAIKAGWKTEPEELLRLAEAVLSGEVKYCPHGRPVAVTLTRKELDKQFKRIV